MEGSPLERIDIAARYTFIKLLGKGGFGQVWLAALKSNGHLRAVKIISHKRITPKKSYKKQHASIADEAKYVEYLSVIPGAEEYVIKFYGVFLGRNHPQPDTTMKRGSEPGLFFVLELEYFQGHTLVELAWAHTDRLIPTDQLCVTVDHLIKAVKFIHAHRVAHRDLKPPNVMFDGQRLVLVDFGLACLFKDCFGMSGTPSYQDPAIRVCRGGSRCEIDWKAADVYSVGKTIQWLVEHSVGSTKEINLLMDAMLIPSVFHRFKLDNYTSLEDCSFVAKKVKRCDTGDDSCTATIISGNQTLASLFT
jgi:serine/threonine protein kinase